MFKLLVYKDNMYLSPTNGKSFNKGQTQKYGDGKTFWRQCIFNVIGCLINLSIVILRIMEVIVEKTIENILFFGGGECKK